MEYIDILDEKENKTGEKRPRKERKKTKWKKKQKNL